MKQQNFFDHFYNQINTKAKYIDFNKLVEMANLIRSTERNSGKIILVGNGGSSAIASHVSIDLTKAASIRAINFNEASLLTCFSNDYGYENWSKEALIAYSDPGDLLILISSSGQSANIINAAKHSQQLGLNLITLSGFEPSNPLRNLGKVNFWINSSNYNYVEMTHHIWLLAICDYVISKN